MIVIRKFVTEEDVEYWKRHTNDEIKEKIKYENEIDGRKVHGIPDGDIDILLTQFRENNFTKYCRKSEWNYDWTNILTNKDEIRSFRTLIAKFRFVNGWNQEDYLQKYKIVVNEDMKILWIGRYEEKQYFVSFFDEIFALGYEHKYLKLFPNIFSENQYFDENNFEKNDELIANYKNNFGKYRYTNIENAQKVFKEEKIGVSISLDEHFEKGFFYKGIKWNMNWDKYFGRNYITLLINIFAKNGFICLEIENITYPFYGYILLDLKEFRIVEAKKL